jgi:hypothetical protein
MRLTRRMRQPPRTVTLPRVYVELLADIVDIIQGRIHALVNISFRRHYFGF